MKKSITSMSPTEFLLRLVRRVGPANRAAKAMLKKRVESSGGISKLNRAYRKLKNDEPAMFQALFAKAFTEKEPEIEDTVWEVDFAGETIKLPLRNGKMWLDWDNAVSIIGHDPEVKKTYENLLTSNNRPKVFFDVGANYGTHSLLFLKHGIRTVTFEPNPNCGQEFMETCRLNDVAGDLIPIAVSDKPGESELWFPFRETWLGSLVESTRDAMAREHEVQKMKVKVTALDDFAASSGTVPDLIKIDTEGNEINVIKGASKTIAATRPLIIFEANQLSDRGELWDTFSEMEYMVNELPFNFDAQGATLSKSGFGASQCVNFIAVPLALFPER